MLQKYWIMENTFASLNKTESDLVTCDTLDKVFSICMEENDVIQYYRLRKHWCVIFISAIFKHAAGDLPSDDIPQCCKISPCCNISTCPGPDWTKSWSIFLPRKNLETNHCSIGQHFTMFWSIAIFWFYWTRGWRIFRHGRIWKPTTAALVSISLCFDISSFSGSDWKSLESNWQSLQDCKVVK